MHIQLIEVPYDSGWRGIRMGAGPGYFVEHGVVEKLRAAGHVVELECIEAQRLFLAENYTAFELNRQLATHVRAARERGAMPLVLAGNCNSALGILGGCEAAQAGVIWFDAHGDFNTPETTTGGFLDGMGLAIATGRCWSPLARSISGFTPVPDERVLLVGVRQLDDGEQELLVRSRITLLKGERIRALGISGSLEPALDGLRAHVQHVYLHIDLDVLDTSIGRANSYAEPGGLLIEEMKQAITLIARRFDIAAVAFTSYDPSGDPAGHIFRAGIQIMEHVLTAVS
ncbi:arginase family protein [Dictyobacter halimunensis]